SGRLEVEKALKVAVEIAGALDRAHRQGLTHRGLNPSNVMLTSSGTKLLDFGMARPNEQAVLPVSASGAITRTTAAPLADVPGSALAYLAPEQFEGITVGPTADIFAFGATLYEMVTGTRAFEGKTPALVLAAVATLDPEPVSKLQPMAPPALDFVV